MITVLRQLLVSQDPRGNRELAIATERVKEEGSKAILRYRRQTHPEDALISPLKVQASDVVIARQGVRHEVTVRDTPGRILLPRVHDQAVAELVGHVSEGVVATVFAQVDRDVGDKGVLCRQISRNRDTNSVLIE